MASGFQDDALLIMRGQCGDMNALDCLIRRHEDRAYKFAYRLTRNPEEAADVVAEAFVRVYRSLHNFKGQSAFPTWLYRILTNCYLDIRKKEKSRPSTSLETALYTPDGEMERQFEDTGRTPLQEAERQVQETTMHAAVDRLPDYQKAIILMYHVEMMTYDEMALSLDLPMGTVKSRLNRARQSLRELLVEHNDLFAVV